VKWIATIVLLLLLLCRASSTPALTIVIDFNDPAQGNTTDVFGNIVSTFSVTSFGFLEADRNTIYDSIMLELDRDYHQIPTVGTDAMSPIPDSMELDIDFVVGDFGTLPSNGDPEYFYMQVGTRAGGTACAGLGCASVSGARTSSGGSGLRPIGTMLGSIYTNNINGLGLLTPSNALTSGDLSATTHAINGTLAHEIGHTVSLGHMRKAGSVTPNGLPPLMGTGAFDLPNQDRIFDREFSYFGFNSNTGSGTSTYVAQLVAAIGLREVESVMISSVPEPSSWFLLAALGSFVLTGRRRIRSRC
jgi:hypothetical protein